MTVHCDILVCVAGHGYAVAMPVGLDTCKDSANTPVGILVGSCNYFIVVTKKCSEGMHVRGRRDAPSPS